LRHPVDNDDDDDDVLIVNDVKHIVYRNEVEKWTKQMLQSSHVCSLKMVFLSTFKCRRNDLLSDVF